MGKSSFRWKQSEPIDLPYNLKGRNLFEGVIPSVCNLEDMLNKLKEVDGNFLYLEQNEKRSYTAYCIDRIEKKVLDSRPDKLKDIVRDNILRTDPFDLGPNCLDIYLVAYVSENYGEGEERFNEFIIENKISNNIESAQAIWQVGTSDGYFLEVLNEDGTVKDWEFFRKWIL